MIALQLPPSPPPALVARIDPVPSASAQALAERLVTPDRMDEFAQSLMLEVLTGFGEDERFAAINAISGRPGAEAAISRFEVGAERATAALRDERPSLIAVIARRYQRDVTADDRARILAFLASDVGRLHEKGGAESFNQPGITAFFASPTGKRFEQYQAALMESRDVRRWHDDAIVRTHARLAPAVAQLLAELDAIAKDPS